MIYDDKGGANAAARAWWMLRAAGHRDVRVLDGGLDAARAEGLPMEAGAGAMEAKPPYPVDRWALPTVDVTAIEERGDRVLVDVRAPERYRGESEPLDPVAGHIPGAINLPLAESLRADGSFKSPEELRALFAAKLAVPAERVVVSCGSGVTACHTLLALEHAGLSGAALYVGSYSEWCRSGREVATGDEGRGA